jgi:hypothetical protein
MSHFAIKQCLPKGFINFITVSYYYDRCLPMGASTSCQIFESFSSSLHWIMENKYCAAGMSHIIDDFLFVA